MTKFADMNKFDLARIRTDIAEMSDTDLGSVVFYPEDSDGEYRYSHLDTLTVPQFQEGGYVNSYRSKQSLTELWSAV